MLVTIVIIVYNYSLQKISSVFRGMLIAGEFFLNPSLWHFAFI